MAGGKGSRFTPLKPLVEVCGVPLFWHSYSLARLFAEEVYLAVVPDSVMLFLDLPKVLTSGRGYEADVVEAVRKVGLPALVLPADVVTSKEAIEALLDRCDADICSLTYRGQFTGVSLWRGEDFQNYSSIESPVPVLNVNTFQDYLLAREACRRRVERAWATE